MNYIPLPFETALIIEYGRLQVACSLRLDNKSPCNFFLLTLGHLLKVFIEPPYKKNDYPSPLCWRDSKQL